jgi:hypothetical protein
MKQHIFISFFSLFLFSSFIYTQSIGFSAGYGFLNMNEVNKDLELFQSLFTGVTATLPEEVTGGLFLEGNFKYGIRNFNLGITGNYISSSGYFSYSDTYGSYRGNYDVSTIEILALFEAVILIENSSIQPFIQLAGGIGLASAERFGKFVYHADPFYTVTNTVDGNYFAGRIKGGLQFVLQNIILELAAGYKIAYAGELKGDHIEREYMFGNEWTVKNMPVEDINGKAIKFDYSGFLFTGGFSIVIQ